MSAGGSSEVLNVDPQKQDDPFYRYKMPGIITKVEGNGNGIKTVFTNMHEVCDALQRPEDVLLKFFGSELGAQATYFKADDKYQVMGQFTRDRVQQKVFDFVERFVLCKMCRNPETNVVFGKRDSLLLQCRACAKVGPVNPGEKIYNALQLIYRTKEAEAQAKGAAAAAAGASAAAAATAAASGATIAEPVAVVAIDPTMKVETTVTVSQGNSILLLKERLLQTSDPDVLAPFAFQLQTTFAIQLSDEKRHAQCVLAAVLCAAPTPDMFLSTLQKYRGFLAVFAEKPIYRETFIFIMLCHCSDAKSPLKFVIGLKLLLEEFIIQEDDIRHWYNKSSLKLMEKERGVPTAFAKEVRETYMPPLMDWLNVGVSPVAEVAAAAAAVAAPAPAAAAGDAPVAAGDKKVKKTKK